MSTSGLNETRKIRASLKHPIIDADGHWAEFAPHMREEFRRIGGDAAVEALDDGERRASPTRSTCPWPSGARRRIGQEAFWFLPTKNTLDRATAMMPRLHLRAAGRSRARLLRHLSDRRARLLPAAAGQRCGAPSAAPTTCSRPTSSARTATASSPRPSSRCTRPRRRIEELEFASRQLGYRVVMMGSLIRRPIPALARSIPRPRSSSSGTTRSASTATTTTIRSGRSAASFASRRASTTARARSCSATRRRTSATTTSATSPRPARRWPRPSSSAASRAASPS